MPFAPAGRRVSRAAPNAAGVATAEVDVLDPVSTGGLIGAGSTWNFQFRYRDAAGGGSQFNLTDATTVDFLP